MNLHEAMAHDLDAVFFNLDDFACEHEINGRKIRCIVDDAQVGVATRAADDFENVSGLGLVKTDRIVLCQAADLIPQPLPGEEIGMDGSRWLVADGGVTETEGMLRLPLNRAY